MTENMKNILKIRAEQLAGKKDLIPDSDSSIEVVEFRLAHEHYGLELIHIREVVLLKQLTPLPGLPGFIAGITNIRGKIFSVVDLKYFFELPKRERTEKTWLIILNSKQMEFGVMADEIVGTRLIQTDMIHNSMATLTDIRGKYLKGITNDSMAILDGAKILEDKNMVVK